MTKPTNFIRAWRKHRGVTLEALSSTTDVPFWLLSKIEQGSRPYTADVLEKLAEALACTPADLIGKDPSEP